MGKEKEKVGEFYEFRAFKRRRSEFTDDDNKSEDDVSKSFANTSNSRKQLSRTYV